MRFTIISGAALSLWLSIGAAGDVYAQSERSIVLAFGFQGQNSGLGFEDRNSAGTQRLESDVTKARRTPTYRKRAPSVLSTAAAPQGNSREALYARCRNAVFRTYGQHYVHSDGGRALALRPNFVVGQVDACVMNGGKPI